MKGLKKKKKEKLHSYVYTAFTYLVFELTDSRSNLIRYAPESQLYALLNMLVIWIEFCLLTSTACFCMPAGQSIWLTPTVGHCYSCSGTTV